MLWPHQHARLSQIAAGSRRQAPYADPQSPGRSWFGQREAKSLVFSSIPCLVVRSARTSWSPPAVLRRLVQGDLRPGQPTPITCPASSEAIDALPGTSRSPPRVVPDETKPAITNRASRGSATSQTFGAVQHCSLLLGIIGV